ncbi:DUF742 domain-containing protein, partial [Streptomyces sp. NPDC028635]|uniref:DUF742 domain-containing protein n=1 Tax=Streptomyces sp. NPDC028635 TaxID=3154800 RepID=UPI0033CCF6BA
PTPSTQMPQVSWMPPYGTWLRLMMMRLFAGGRGGLAVADVAAALELPPSTVRIIVSALMDSGHLTAPASAEENRPGSDLLQEVLRGLRELV